MALQKKTPPQATKTPAKVAAIKSSAGAKSLKKPSTRDTLKKATPVKRSSALLSTSKKPMSRKDPTGKSSVANKNTVIKNKAPAQKAAAAKSAPEPKKAVSKQPAAAKSVSAKSSAAKTKTVKATVAKKVGKADKSTTELLQAIKARDTETQENSNSSSAVQSDATGTGIAAEVKPGAKKRIPLAIVPPMQKAVEIIAPSSSSKKKVRKFSFSQKDLTDFRSELLLMRDHFAGQTKSMKHDALQRDDEVNPEEDGTDAFMRLQALNQMDDQQHIVADIDMALNAIEKGTYGTCEMCDCLISKLRLKARPFAKFCVKCKSEMERLTRFNKPR